MVRIVPWGEGDRELLAQCVGDAAMMEHLGGAESPEKIDERQARYAVPDSHQFKIVDAGSGAGAGWVGYWERDDEAYEIGWAVIPAFQGRGVASQATRLALQDAREHGDRRYVFAYPSVDNGPSNGLCRKLGFELMGTTDYEYPPGNPMRCNDWRFDLGEFAIADPDA
jgi:RimJ/RimL family protein N-acetyltransferase